jgi:hypothetical protein
MRRKQVVMSATTPAQPDVGKAQYETNYYSWAL